MEASKRNLQRQWVFFFVFYDSQIIFLGKRVAKVIAAYKFEQVQGRRIQSIGNLYSKFIDVSSTWPFNINNVSVMSWCSASSHIQIWSTTALRGKSGLSTKLLSMLAPWQPLSGLEMSPQKRNEGRSWQCASRESAFRFSVFFVAKLINKVT